MPKDLSFEQFAFRGRWGKVQRFVYTWLCRLRPTQIGATFKTLLGIRRHYVRTAAGQIFFADPASHFGLQILTEGTYEPDTFHLMSMVLRPEDTFLDVGANEGYFSILAGLRLSKGVVHSLEPQSRLQPVLRENLRINSLHNRVRLHPVALDSKEGKKTLFLRPTTNTGASSFYRYWTFGAKQEVVLCTTLDDFYRSERLAQIRMIKLDCEGAEHSILLGAKKILSEKRVDFILMMYHPHIVGRESCDEAHRILLENHYDLSLVDGQPVYHRKGLEKELRPKLTLEKSLQWVAA